MEKVYYHGYKGLKEHSRALSDHIVFTKQGYGKNLCRATIRRACEMCITAVS